MTPRTRKVDQTERCAKCGKRADRREMLLDRWHDPDRWYCRECWDARHAKEAKQDV
jgi:hypothetical protein